MAISIGIAYAACSRLHCKSSEVVRTELGEGLLPIEDVEQRDEDGVLDGAQSFDVSGVGP